MAVRILSSTLIAALALSSAVQADSTITRAPTATLAPRADASPLPLTDYTYAYSALPYKVNPYAVGRGPQVSSSLRSGWACAVGWARFADPLNFFQRRSPGTTSVTAPPRDLTRCARRSSSTIFRVRCSSASPRVRVWMWVFRVLHTNPSRVSACALAPAPERPRAMEPRTMPVCAYLTC